MHTLYIPSKLHTVLQNLRSIHNLLLKSIKIHQNKPKITVNEYMRNWLKFGKLFMENM